MRSLLCDIARRPQIRDRLYTQALESSRQNGCTSIRQKSSKSDDDFQAKSLDGYYAELLSHPLKETVPATRLESELPSYNWLPKSIREETIAKARAVFGSRTDASDRRRELEASSRKIAGILVPPRPSEPDNCCMSGCVNCVWDQYRDELEEWAAKSTEARGRLEAQRMEMAASTNSGTDQPTHVISSIDDDGGGSDTNWIDAGPNAGKDLFEDVPIGIREFMKAEKRLKEKRAREAQLSS